EDLATEVGRLVQGLKLSVKPPSVRTIRLWRTKRLLSKGEGGGFERRQILEALAAAVLLETGWSSKAVADTFAGSDDAGLARVIQGGGGDALDQVAVPVTPGRIEPRRYAHEAAEDAAILLAQGVIGQYEQVLAGKDIVRQNDSVPSQLHRAMIRLGRLY